MISRRTIIVPVKFSRVNQSLESLIAAFRGDKIFYPHLEFAAFFVPVVGKIE